jgi:hypothetical protein
MAFLVDPLGFWGIYDIELSAVVVSMASPFSFSAILLISFYW